MPPTEEGDAAAKGYIDSKSVGESDLNMNGNLIKNVRWPEDHDSVNRAYVYFVAGKTLPIEGGTMQGQIDMRQHSIRNISPNPQNEDEVIPQQWIEENSLNPCIDYGKRFKHGYPLYLIPGSARTKSQPGLWSWSRGVGVGRILNLRSRSRRKC